MFNDPEVWNRFLLVMGIWGASSLCMVVWLLIYGLYYKEEAVTLLDAIKAFFICLIPAAAPIGLLVWVIFYLEDHSDKVLFRSKKAAAKEMAERMTGDSEHKIRDCHSIAKTFDAGR